MDHKRRATRQGLALELELESPCIICKAPMFENSEIWDMCRGSEQLGALS